jgi:hypothetical protein
MLSKAADSHTIWDRLEGSHSGLVRAPAKRLPYVSGVVGSNPAPSAMIPPFLPVSPNNQATKSQGITKFQGTITWQIHKKKQAQDLSDGSEVPDRVSSTG